MKKIVLIAVMLVSPAFGQESNISTEPHVETPALTSVPAPAPEAKPTPPPAAVAPAPSPQPTAWNIEGLDAGDLATLNEALENLPMRVYRQFTVRLQQKIKPVR